MYQQFYQKILSFLLPQSCRICRTLLKDSQKICTPCLKKIPWVEGASCTICGMPFPSAESLSHPCLPCLKDSPAFDWHRSCVVYQEPTTHLLYQFKFNHGLDLTPLFSEWMTERYHQKIKEADYLIPVPLSRKRLRKRTYNQSLEICKKISSITGVPFLLDSLQKTKETVPQVGLKKNERIKNLKGAFEWRDKKNNLKDTNIILIDDVYSTGSTLSACAKVIRELGVQEVGAMTVAINPLG